jgi:hypothetical protein
MFEGFQPDFRYNRMMNSNDLEDALQALPPNGAPPGSCKSQSKRLARDSASPSCPFPLDGIR